MKITKASENELILASHENLWMLLLLPLIVSVLGLCFLESRFDLIGLGVSATVLITWLAFSYYVSDAEIILDKRKDIFSFKSSRFFGGREEFKCALGEISGVVLEREIGQENDSYRIGIVTENGTKYPSKIFRYSTNRSVEKAYMAIREYIIDETSNNANKPFQADAAEPRG